MIFVTGATGNIGSEVVQELSQAGAAFRVGQRTLPTKGKAKVKCVLFDFLKADTFAPALKGCNAVFLLRPPAISKTRKTLNAFIDGARNEGVSQIVFISVIGAGTNPLLPHHAVEQHLRSGPSGWTILRPSFFAQNFGDAYRQDIARNHCIYLPSGLAKVAFIDTRDIAEVAVNALLNPSAHQDKTHTLTGPEALTFEQAAALLTSELCVSVIYQATNPLAYFTHFLRQGLPMSPAVIQTALHVGLRWGQAKTVSSDLSQLLGHDGYSLQEYMHDYRQLWMP
jgi:uncharacterized protein YbjT (DUF2867 family)